MPLHFSSLFERIEQKKTVQKQNLKNAISGPNILYSSTWKSNEQIGSKGTLNSMTSAHHLPCDCRVFEGIWIFLFCGVRWKVCSAEPFPFTILHFNTVTSQPRPFLAAKTSVNAEVRVENPRALNTHCLLIWPKIPPKEKHLIPRYCFNKLKVTYFPQGMWDDNISCVCLSDRSHTLRRFIKDFKTLISLSPGIISW